MPVNTAMAKLRIGMRLKNPVFWVLLAVGVMLVIAALIPPAVERVSGHSFRRHGTEARDGAEQAGTRAHKIELGQARHGARFQSATFSMSPRLSEASSRSTPQPSSFCKISPAMAAD
jgi:hypothetical protein